MNERWNSVDLQDLGPLLAKAVQAVVVETPPDDAVLRVIDRAKRLQMTATGDPLTANVPVPSLRKTRSLGRIVAWTASGATVTAAAFLLGLFLISGSTRLSWAEMLTAVGSRPWVHGITTYSDGEQTATSESWVSTGNRSAAYRFGDKSLFEEIETGISLQYDAKERVIYRVPSLRIGPGRFRDAHLPGLLDRLIADKTDSRELFYGERVIKAERHQIDENGKPCLDYLIHLERIENTALNRTVRIRVDRVTQLPVSWEERQADGGTAVTRFDYPPKGPRNIYDLGVPKTATLIDRVPKGDLARIVAAQRTGRLQFDPYDAIVVQHTEGRPSTYDQMTNLSVHRVRRKNGKYRVDQFLIAKTGLVPPAPGTDMRQWWKANRDRYWSVPQLICDGETTRHYKMRDDRVVPGKEPNLSVVVSSQVPLNLPIDDPVIGWPHLMPEQCSRPHLWNSDKTREFDVDAETNDGLQDTVRVIVTTKSEPRSGELYRYWFDPDRDYILRKEISAAFDDRTKKLAYLDTEEYDQFAQSPSGKWYPQRVRRTTTNHPQNPRWQGMTQFFLDFETVPNDDLFRPVSPWTSLP
jgi:hypothetical protein